MRARQTSVEPARDCPLGLVAGERPFERLPKGFPSTEQEGFDLAELEVEELRDLRVRPALLLTHNERRALIEVEPLERSAKIARRGRLIVLEQLLG